MLRNFDDPLTLVIFFSALKRLTDIDEIVLYRAGAWGTTMTGLVESATAVMRMAEQRLEVVARNVANISTPGYKRRVAFADVVIAGAKGRDSAIDVPEIAIRDDGTQARMTETGNPFDLAISGAGYFRVRAGDEVLYTRQGQFRRDAEGLLVSPQGYVLQQAAGGDLVLDGVMMTVRADGTVLDGERPIARIAIEIGADAAAMTPVGESFYRAPGGAMGEAEGVMVRQGMLEGSNVTLGDEMTQSMVAVRQAESGARLIQVYDELMGRAVGAFGGNGR